MWLHLLARPGWEDDYSRGKNMVLCAPGLCAPLYHFSRIPGPIDSILSHQHIQTGHFVHTLLNISTKKVKKYRTKTGGGRIIPPPPAGGGEY